MSLNFGQWPSESVGHVTAAAGADVCVCVSVQGRTAADFDEPLRIEEDSHWPTEQR